MILSSHQLGAFGGNLALWHKVYLADAFVCLDTLQYNHHDKEKFENRQRIKTCNGWQWIIIPCERKEPYAHQRLCDVKITKSGKWIERVTNALHFNYSKAAYFDELMPMIDGILWHPVEYLANINWDFFKLVYNYLELKTPISLASSANFYPFSKKNNMIIDLCRSANADGFLFGIKGKEYADQELFNKFGIKCYFQEYKHPRYTQCFEEQGFVEQCSILDLLLNHGKEALKILLEGNIKELK